MPNLTTRVAKGSPLTVQEMDDNLLLLQSGYPVTTGGVVLQPYTRHVLDASSVYTISGPGVYEINVPVAGATLRYSTKDVLVDTACYDFRFVVGAAADWTTATKLSEIIGIDRSAVKNGDTNLGISGHTTSGFTLTSSTGANVSVPAASSSLAGLMTGAQFTKLSGIATGAQVNVPTNLGSSTTTTAVSLTSSTGTGATVAAATPSAAGVMTAADKSKLDGIAAGAQVNVPTNLGSSAASTAVSLTSSTGTGATLAAATTSVAGVMTAADKAKLDGIAAGAQVNVGTNIGSSATSTAVSLTSSTGTGATLAAATTSVAGVMAAADKAKLDGIAAGAQVTSVAGRTGAVTLTKSDVGLSNVDNTADSAKPVSTAQQSALNLKANLASPALTGTPTAPTAVDGTSSTQLATTAFVQGAVGGFLEKSTTGGTITLTTAEASNPVIKVSGALTANAILEVPVASKRNYSIENATTGAFTLTVKHVGLTPSVLVAQGKRNIVMTNGVGAYDAINDFESIALTGTPTAPTAGSTTDTTQLATTAFVQAVNASDTGSAATAVKLKTARTIGGVAFDGSANINLPGVNTAGNQNTTGSAATLTTARTINGTSFNGSANITTANWGAATTLTIGSTGKSVNGSAAVSWSLTEIGAAAASHIHSIADVSGLQAALNDKVPMGGEPSFSGIELFHATPFIDFHFGNSAADYTSRIIELSSGSLTCMGNWTASGNVTAYSDLRLKKDLVEIEGALDKLKQLAGYTYTRTDTGDRQAGLIAQDVQSVLPEVVQENADGYLSVAYGNLLALVINAVNELHEIVKGQKS